jgi:hypothetical protein
VTVREPRFTEQDRAELLALQLYRDGLCPACGRPLEVCTAPEETGAKFDVSWQVCNATRTLLEAQRGAYEDKQHPNAPAHLWGTTIRKR